MGVQGDIFDPRTNIMAGTRLLRWLANRVDGDLVLTIAGYHAGLGSLAKFGYTVPPYTYTRQYLKMVLDRYYQYKSAKKRAARQRQLTRVLRFEVSEVGQAPLPARRSR